MKKIISITIVAITMVTLLMCAGCSTSTDVDLKSVLSDINSKYSDSTSGLTELTDVNDLNKYYNINTDDVAQFAAEITSDTSKAPVEIVMVEAKNADAVSNIENALNARYQGIYSTYASYSAEQFDMVKKCKVTKNGNYIILVVAEDYDGIVSIINKAIG
ncbi:MAG: DUF4358 domain-containing protein [Ruminococcus sp.]